MTVDQSQLIYAEILARYRAGDKIEVDLPYHTFKILERRGIIDSEHRLTEKGCESVLKHIQIHDFLNERTLENYALNYASLYESLINGDTGEWEKLNYVVRRKLRIRGLVKRKKLTKGWAIQPTNLWEKIVNEHHD